MTFDAALSPAEIAQLPAQDLSQTTCIVFDVLRATSSMLTAVAHGAREIWPVATIEDALALHATMPEALLGGERHGDRIEGFDLGNSPFEYRRHPGRSIISTTTNGTVALRACAHAHQVLIGAVLNLQALADFLRTTQPSSVLLVCAGTFNTFALEDAWAAGRLLQLLAPDEMTDAAQACLAAVHLHPTPLAALQAARNGRALAAKNRADEVAYCAQESHLDTLGAMRDGQILRISLPPY